MTHKIPVDPCTEKDEVTCEKIDLGKLNISCKHCSVKETLKNDIAPGKCMCGQPIEINVRSSKISMSYSKLKKRKQKSRKSLDKKNRQLLAKCNDSILPPEQGSWLLRLFESKLFNMPIAISYMFNSKEDGVLAYLGNKLFVSIIFYVTIFINGT